jgi:hypothetical protein
VASDTTRAFLARGQLLGHSSLRRLLRFSVDFAFLGIGFSLRCRQCRLAVLTQPLQLRLEGSASLLGGDPGRFRLRHLLLQPGLHLLSAALGFRELFRCSRFGRLPCFLARRGFPGGTVLALKL